SRLRMARCRARTRHDHHRRVQRRERRRPVSADLHSAWRPHRPPVRDRSGSCGPFRGTGRRVMQAIILREALIAARKPALVSAAIVSAAVMAMFPVAWGVRGIPTLDGASLYDQQFRLEW